MQGGIGQSAETALARASAAAVSNKTFFNISDNLLWNVRIEPVTPEQSKVKIVAAGKSVRAFRETEHFAGSVLKN